MASVIPLKLELEQERLEKYISLLDERLSVTLRLLYVESKSTDVVAEKLNITTRTVRTLRNNAVDKLCDMYEYASRFGGDISV